VGAVIAARDLTKRYGAKVAVDHLSFTVQPVSVTGSWVRTVPVSRPRCGCCWAWTGRKPGPRRSPDAPTGISSSH
jgi:hypothetical protein